MRSRYGYSIVHDDNQFSFRLIPGNKGLQRIGESRKYDTYDNCVNTLKAFRSFVVDNQSSDVKSPYIKHSRAAKRKIRSICL